MSLFIGAQEGETLILNLTLTSNASLDQCPNNTNTLFTNHLPREIINKETHQPFLLLRVTRAFIPCGLVPEQHLTKVNANDAMQIRIREVTTQIVNQNREQIAAVFDLRDDDPRQIFDPRNDLEVDRSTPKFPFHNSHSYIIKEFSHSPILQILDRSLKTLTFHLTLINGESYPCPNDVLLPPTIIDIEILSPLIREMESSVYCVSIDEKQQYNLYPKNNITDFTCKLPHAIDVANYEVCLSSISMPTYPSHENLFVKITLIFHPNPDPPDDISDISEEISIPIKANMSKKVIIYALAKAINDKQSLRTRASALASGAYQWVNLSLHVKNKEEDLYLTVKWNNVGCALFGYPHRNSQAFVIIPTSQQETQVRTRSRTHTAQLVGRFNSFSTDDFFAPEIAFIYCDIIKPNPVGDSMSHLLEIIPLSYFKTDDHHANGVRLFSPCTVKYKPVGVQTISEITFKIVRVDGRPIRFPLITKETLKHSGGTIIELKFRKEADLLAASRMSVDGQKKQAHEISRYTGTWKRNIIH